ncbi:MAG: hypothetical protein EOO93_19610, partial [Pedobacter sp.]
MVKQYSTKNFSHDKINVDVESRIISGYASAFNSVDSDGDVIVKGAFTKTLQENGVESLNPRIFHLYQHNISQVLGRPLILKEDDYGLYFETKIAKIKHFRTSEDVVVNGVGTELYQNFSRIIPKAVGLDPSQLRLLQGSQS